MTDVISVIALAAAAGLTREEFEAWKAEGNGIRPVPMNESDAWEAVDEWRAWKTTRAET